MEEKLRTLEKNLHMELVTLPYKKRPIKVKRVYKMEWTEKERHRPIHMRLRRSLKPSPHSEGPTMKLALALS
ncbi:unnamed protein product [Sphenostylis stenocarpa]|uniref:Uncharacterized protein n=1 Tax=Sphenostylis stenocarpa TaxID=92480 RepID=A0AA86SZU5_9FABA|nr:unnamed protein product [Sphenostylis stenocarpa]